MQRRSNPSCWRRTCPPSTSGWARRSAASAPASNARATRVQRSDASAAFGSSTRQAAESTTALEAEVEKLRAVLVTVHVGAEAMKDMLDAMGELDARIRAGRDTEQTATAVRQIGEALRTITAQAEAATARAAEATELFDALRRSARTTEDETRRAAEALRALATEAEARTEALRQRQGSGWRFWNRSR